jgi:serralysin
VADVRGDTSTTSSLTIGGTATSTLESNGDHDWFAINLTAGQQVTVTIFGITLVDPLLNIRNSAGVVISTNDDIKSGSDRNSEITFTPTTSGAYYIDVGAFNEAYSGTYQVSVQAGTTPPLASVDTLAGYLAQGYWGGDAHHFAVGQGGSITVNISTLNAAEQNLARVALQEWSDVIGVRFQEVTTGGQIAFDNSEDSSGSPVAATDANWSRGITSSAHVQISSSWVNRYGTGLNTYSLQTYIHEIGHALGLGHQGDYNGSATYSTDALFQNDAWSMSIMSYFDERQNTYFGNQGFSRDFAVTPMDADIVAMQTLYGLSTTTRTGDTIYGFNSNAGGVYNASAYPNVALTIFDGGGTDTLDYSATAASQLLNLNPETFSNVDGQTGNLVIARGVVIENAIGGSGADTIVGNDAANVLVGNLGADTLTGGAGNDIFKDTRAGHSGDTIVDFAAGDQILITDATLAGFSFNLSGHTLTYTGGSLTLTNVPAGQIVASAASGGGVQLGIGTQIVPVAHAVHNDFNGDHRSDILLHSDGTNLAEWTGQPNGGFVSNANVNYTLGSNWTVAGTGDFNGDGRVDLLLRYSLNGMVAEWSGQPNGSFVGNANANYSLDAAWKVAGVGDFNGDGLSDLLLRNDNGTMAEWNGQSNGNFVGNANANYALSASWQVAGTGDFNGDGIDDLLLRNDNGMMAEWNGQSNGSFVGNANANYALSASWHVAGTGDFNGDGLSDLLLRNDNGFIAEWNGQANGSFVGNANVNYPLSTSWHVAEIGDFNGDGLSDLLLRNDNGFIAEWNGQPNGSFVGNPNVNYPLATSWHVQDPFVHDPFQ